MHNNEYILYHVLLVIAPFVLKILKFRQHHLLSMQSLDIMLFSLTFIQVFLHHFLNVDFK